MRLLTRLRAASAWHAGDGDQGPVGLLTGCQGLDVAPAPQGRDKGLRNARKRARRGRSKA